MPPLPPLGARNNLARYTVFVCAPITKACPLLCVSCIARSIPYITGTTAGACRPGPPLSGGSANNRQTGAFQMGKTTHAKVVIIGSGPAGYTAAIYAARAMLEPVLIQGIQPGGQLTITTDVENYPGFADVIQGPWLMEQMQKQAEHVGTRIVTDHVTKVELARRPFRLTCDSGDIYLAESLSSRPARRRAGSSCRPSRSSRAIGVSACATCDGFFYRGKEVVGDRRRQHRGRGGAVPRQLRLQGHGRAPARQLPRREDPAGPAAQESEDLGDLELRARRSPRQREPAQGQRRQR